MFFIHFKFLLILVGKNWSQPFKPEFLNFHHRFPCWAWMYICALLYVLGSTEHVSDNQTSCNNWGCNILRRKQDVSRYGSSQVYLVISVNYVTYLILSFPLKCFLLPVSLILHFVSSQFFASLVLLKINKSSVQFKTFGIKIGRI